MKTLVMIATMFAALFALQPAFAALDTSSSSHGDGMRDCDKTGGKGTRHGDCPR